VRLLLPAAPLDKTGLADTGRPPNLVVAETLRPDETSILADGRRVPFTPGTVVTTETKTGSRGILEYVFSPLVSLRRRRHRCQRANRFDCEWPW